MFLIFIRKKYNKTIILYKKLITSYINRRYMRRYRGECVYLAIGSRLSFYGHFSPRHLHAPNDIACVVVCTLCAVVRLACLRCQSTPCRCSLIACGAYMHFAFFAHSLNGKRSTDLFIGVHHVASVPCV